MHLLDSYSQTFLSTGQERSDKQRENFKIATFSLVNSKLNIGVQNTGDIPINITRLWIQNTTTTDWFQTYSIKINVPPGTTASNVGQSVPLYINSANSYNIKLVTERGNSQQFSVNSPNFAPLNIQLLALPPNVASGFQSQLIMIVTNNGSSTLTNLSPAPLPSPTGSASCAAGPVSPTSYNTLPPGQTAVFSWTVKATAPADGWSCKYTASLQNGYPGQSVQATITVSAIQLSSTTFAQNSGILTLNYTTMAWTQGGSWNTGWSVPGNTATILKLNVTNNNATTNTNLYLSKNSQILLVDTQGSTTTPLYIVTNASSLSPLAVNPYTCGGPNDYCISLPYGKQVTLYFAAGQQQGGTGTMKKVPGPGHEAVAFLVVYGKYSTSQSTSGSLYGQSLPYMGFEFS
ncbi:MAG: hypothetical protein AUI61_04185 [Thaumarchaeota archaeon 13_1_40CM_2_39_13_2]|nr:MAG: hypothetical protein AUI61_04185 [Thaumarchaeota archaeon 13_1_40CM_2_39_13_2]OLE41114.1 MAG: hypothetical protein AUG16_01265 [Thaumarchaeota archaeon 13_1_20CM_2_39_20]